HVVDGDLICPHPTTTKERGDDTWTPAEQRVALEVSARLMDERRGLLREEETTVMLLASGLTSDGYAAFLTALARAKTLRLYASLHGDTSKRLTTVLMTAARRRGSL